MSLPGLPRLDIEVRDRRGERRIAVVASALALCMPWLMVPAISAPIAAGAGLLSAIAVVAGFHHAGWWRGPRRIERVIWSSDGEWLLIDASGRKREVQLATDTRMGPGCVWLHWQTTRPHTLLLLLCDVSADQLRRLSVRLRIDRRSDSALPRAAAPRVAA